VTIGSDTGNVLAFAVNAPSGIYGEDEVRERMVAALVERLGALPGVIAAAASRQPPLDGFGWTSDFTIDAWPADRFGLDVRHRQMTAGYFPTLRIPLVSGRRFVDRPRNGQPFEVVVNRTFAERYFPGADPVGQRVTFSRVRDADADWHPIVGVVGDERMSIRQPPMPEILGPLISDMPGIPHVLVRAAGAPAALVPSVRAVVAQVDSQIALAGVRSMDDTVARALVVERFTVVLLGVFAVIGLVLAAVAVHGLTAQVVRSRAEELRIRKVLGATDGSLVATLLRPLVVILLGGLGLGVAGASAASEVAHAYWFGPPPMDAGVIAWALAWLMLAAGLGTVVPIRQAIRVAPAGACE
jgi:putative ABC transport system permease protein